MEVIIDGQRNFEVRGTPADVFEVVAAISEHLSEQRLAMMSLRVDGEELRPEQVPEKLLGLDVASVRTIEVGVSPLKSLVSDCLAELEEALPHLPKACRDLAAIFHGDTPEEGYDPFTELAALWGHVKNREKLVVEALELDLNQLQVSGMNAELLHTELNQFLQEAAEAIKNGDTILLGDLLEYELAPRAEKEKDLVALLQARSAAASG